MQEAIVTWTLSIIIILTGAAMLGLIIYMVA